ncbi:MAG: hypothetical protein RSE41_00165 [Clostridia bacterium]
MTKKQFEYIKNNANKILSVRIYLEKKKSQEHPYNDTFYWFRSDIKIENDFVVIEYVDKGLIYNYHYKDIRSINYRK